MKDETVFYSMISLMKTAETYGRFLVDSKSVVGNIKHEINNFNKQVHRFVTSTCDRLSPSERTQWMNQWNDRDYQAFIEIMNYMINMSDDKVARVEAFAKELSLE